MFGYVTICEPELKMKDLRKYRAYYCGLCRTLKERHGNIGQLTLTYDMTFTIILMNSLYECPINESAYRCKVHPVKKQIMLQNEITEYAADMNLLLAYYHLKDDWEDEKKISGLAGTRVLRRKAKKVEALYPRQSKAIERELKALAECEAEDSLNIDQPAGSFGRLMEELFIYKEDVWEETLRKVGFYLGKFIYIMDAYEDLEKDLKEGNYNPLKVMSTHPDYEERIRQMLCMMIAECSAAFEKLPCLQDEDILRNILYAGVWNRYNKIHAEKNDKADASETKGKNKEKKSKVNDE